MSKSQTLRALVNERLTAAAEEIFVLFERTIAEYEEEVCRSKEENQRKQELLDSMLSPSKSPGSGLDQDPPQTPRIKEEPEEPSVKQEEHTLLVQVSVGVPESSAVCMKTEESSLLQQRQTELREETQGDDISTEPHLHSSDTDNDKEWRARFSCSPAQMETDTDGDHYNQVQKVQRLRALVKEIFALFERMIEEYEEEVCCSKEKNQRKQELLDSMLSPSKSPGPGLDQDPPQTPRIKEEPEEPSAKQEEHILLVKVGVPGSSAVCVMTEESSLLRQRQTELREETQGENISAEPHLHSSNTHSDEDWRTAQMETDADGDDYNEPEEPSVKQEEEQVLVDLPESSRLQQRQTKLREETQGEDISAEPHFRLETEGDTEHSSDTDSNEDWRAPLSCSAAQMETDADGDNYKQVQIRARSSTAQTSGLSPKYKSASESSAFVNNGDMSGTPQGVEKPFSCSTCEKRFFAKSHLDLHLRTHTGERPYSCLFCEKSFTQKSNLKKHLRTHTGERPYSCSFCEKSFAQKSTLNEHLLTHTGERAYSCPFCEKSFALKSTLNTHLKTHTGERPYSCSLCEKSFALKRILNAHLKTHAGERPYSCSLCEKSFAQKANLSDHLRTHTGERPYSCSFCEKSFPIKGILNAHLKTHTGERPYSCSLCEKSFALKGTLNTHLKTHTGERPYSCSICEKSFALKGTLNKHLKTHTGERPYSCSLCEKSFTQKGTLNEHLKTHTGERP